MSLVLMCPIFLWSHRRLSPSNASHRRARDLFTFPWLSECNCQCYFPELHRLIAELGMKLECRLFDPIIPTPDGPVCRRRLTRSTKTRVKLRHT